MDDTLKQLNSLDQNSVTQLLGMMQPGGFDIVALIASFIFGVVGFYAFMNGKKNGSWKRMIVGVLLMGYSYFTPGAWATCGGGIALSVLLYYWRDQ